MFSTTLNQEYQVAADLLDLNEHGVAELARQAVRYSFLDDRGKATVLAEIDDYLEVFSRRAAAAASRIAGEPR
jgi:adenosine deaminase/aminodeoxyfutalosine deaminase